MLTMLICLMYLLYIVPEDILGKIEPHDLTYNQEDATITLPWYTTGFL